MKKKIVILIFLDALGGLMGNSLLKSYFDSIGKFFNKNKKYKLDLPTDKDKKKNWVVEDKPFRFAGVQEFHSIFENCTVFNSEQKESWPAFNSKQKEITIILRNGRKDPVFNMTVPIKYLFHEKNKFKYAKYLFCTKDTLIELREYMSPDDDKINGMKVICDICVGNMTVEIRPYID